MSKKKKFYSELFPEIDSLLRLPFHVYCKDKMFRYLFCSEMMAENLSLKKSTDIIGLTDEETLVSKASAEEFRKQDKKIIQTQVPGLFTDSAKYKKNHLLHFMTMKTPLWDENRNLCAVLGFSITTDQQAFLSLSRIFTALNIQFEKFFPRNAFTSLILQQEKKLSQREKECLLLLVRGYSASKIADHLNLSKRTVEDYLERAKDKLNCYTKQELIEYAINHYLIDIN